MTAWTEPVSSFAAAIIDGPATSGAAWGTVVTGSVVDHERVMNSHAVQVSVTWTGAGGFQSYLQGSLDGANFYNIGGSFGEGISVIENVPARYVQATLIPYTDHGPPTPELTVTILVIAQESA